MTLRDAIERVDGLKHNTYTTEEKVAWLSQLDGVVKGQIIDTHESDEEVSFDGYTVNDLDAQLLIPAPYEDIYIRWLEAQIDYYNGEIGRYNNSIMMYQTAYDAYNRHYNRTHMPKGQIFKF